MTYSLTNTTYTCARCGHKAPSGEACPECVRRCKVDYNPTVKERWEAAQKDGTANKWGSMIWG